MCGQNTMKSALTVSFVASSRGAISPFAAAAAVPLAGGAVDEWQSQPRSPETLQRPPRYATAADNLRLKSSPPDPCDVSAAALPETGRRVSKRGQAHAGGWLAPSCFDPAVAAPPPAR